MNTNDPFNFLLELEQRTLKGSSELPTIDQVSDTWVGVGFRIGKSKLIADMSDIKEILDLPEYTLVPGVKSWVVGVANVRGSLLPILDMKAYLMGEDIKQRHRGRVIVISYKGFNTGLIVEEVYGMRHFSENDVSTDAPEVPESISPYVDKMFKQDEESWPVFDFHELEQDERFALASL
jgi:twitching motility protein PilI